MRNTPTISDPAIVSITTIYSRKDCATSTLKRLLRQETELPYEVHLYISQEPYLLDKGFEVLPEEFEKLTKQHSNFKVKWVENTGPYRKLLPALMDAWASAKDQIIITCDDDVEYPHNFIQSIIEAHFDYKCIVAFRGHTIQLENGCILPYQAWQNAPHDAKSLSNLPTGKDGVLYRSSYFHENVFNRKEISCLAPTSDDLWFKWHTALKKIPVAFITEGDKVEFRSAEDLDVNETLWRKFNKFGGNDETVDKLERHFQKKYCMNLSTLLAVDSKTSGLSQALSRPSLLKAANNSFRSGHAEQAEYLYKQIICRSPNNFSALFNLAHLRTRMNLRFKARIACYQRGIKANTASMPRTRTDQSSNSIENDLVLVIIPAFNSEKTLRQSVESALNQSHQNHLILIVDDCSQDSTLSIAFDLENQYEKVLVISLDRNSGPFVACNFALDAMHIFDFAYYIKHDADDLMLSDKINKQVNAINSGDYFFCTTGYARISYPSKRIVSGKNRGHNMTLYRREVFDTIGFFDDTRFGGDSEYLERAIARFGAHTETHISERLTLAYIMPDGLVSLNPLGSDLRSAYIDKYRNEHATLASNLFKPFPEGRNLAYSSKACVTARTPENRNQHCQQHENRISDHKRTICVAFPTFNRQALMSRLIQQLDTSAKDFNLILLVFDDGSLEPANIQWGDYKNITSGKLVRYENHGKKKYWSLVNKIFAAMQNVKANYYFYLGDDLEVREDFFEKAIGTWECVDDPNKISLNLLNDGREKCWTNFPRKKIRLQGREIFISQWLDMIMIISPKIFEYEIQEIPMSRWSKNPLLSSGVGSQLSSRLLADGFNMYQVVDSLVFHGTHESEMNPEERIRRPLVAITTSL